MCLEISAERPGGKGILIFPSARATHQSWACPPPGGEQGRVVLSSGCGLALSPLPISMCFGLSVEAAAFHSSEV